VLKLNCDISQFVRTEINKGRYTKNTNTRILLLSILYSEWLNKDIVVSQKLFNLFRKQLIDYQHKAKDLTMIFRTLGYFCPTFLLNTYLDTLISEHIAIENNRSKQPLFRLKVVQVCAYILFLSIEPSDPQHAKELHSLGKRIMHILYLLYLKKKINPTIDLLCTDLIQQVLVTLPQTISPFLECGGGMLFQSLFHQPIPRQDMQSVLALSNCLLPLAAMSADVYELVCIPATVQELCLKLIAVKGSFELIKILQALQNMLITIQPPSRKDESKETQIQSLAEKLDSMWLIIKIISSILTAQTISMNAIQGPSVQFLSTCHHVLPILKLFLETFPSRSFESIADRNNVVNWCEETTKKLVSYQRGIASNTRQGLHCPEKKVKYDITPKVLQLLSEIANLVKTLQPYIRPTPIKATNSSNKKRSLEADIGDIEDDIARNNKKSKYEPSVWDEAWILFEVSCHGKHILTRNPLVCLDRIFSLTQEIPQVMHSIVVTHAKLTRYCV
jgi:hypothetical protein